MEQNNLQGLIAPLHFIEELKAELARFNITPIYVQDRFFIINKPSRPILWVDEVLHDVTIQKIESISDASKKLKAECKTWIHFGSQVHRRGELILENLGTIKKKPIPFLYESPDKPYGVFGLMDQNTLFYSTKPQSKIPLGEIEFNEDKINPPSRAYLKLWETFTVQGLRPKAQEKVIDVGSCPGGWTWVLQTLGCEVTSVDKAPLDPKIAALPNITFLEESAFGLNPEKVGKLDWFFSDIICYPAKLFELVQKWHKSGLVKNFVCTIKFQGETDYETMDKFLTEFPGSRIVHLYCNKHEVTWIYQS
jgi:23S rRNA (cytidine2498-2'-O)-methyltransferase